MDFDNYEILDEDVNVLQTDTQFDTTTTHPNRSLLEPSSGRPQKKPKGAGGRKTSDVWLHCDQVWMTDEESNKVRKVGNRLSSLNYFIFFLGQRHYGKEER